MVTCLFVVNMQPGICEIVSSINSTKNSFFLIIQLRKSVLVKVESLHLMLLMTIVCLLEFMLDDHVAHFHTEKRHVESLIKHKN